MRALFEGMMRQVVEKQDAMQHGFMETLDRWEAERTAREEAWRLKEVARMDREQEQLARERAFMETLDRWEAERTVREEAWRLEEVTCMNCEQEQLARERAARRDAVLPCSRSCNASGACSPSRCSCLLPKAPSSHARSRQRQTTTPRQPRFII
ncbi:hypothetical protein ACP4OV_027983 [Aristida adscensionis]